MSRIREEKRKLGIGIFDEAPWGTHLCQFYDTREDLIDILVPYFKTGLENNEFCMWVTSVPLEVEDAKAALQRAVANLDDYVEKGQIEILDYKQWYTKSGKFDADEVMQGWVEKENQAVKRGFDGLRLTGNTFWLEREDWREFSNYEAIVDNVIGRYRMLAICSYSLEKCGASELIDVVMNHKLALVRRHGEWNVFESMERKRAEKALKESEERYHTIFELAADSIVLVDAETGELAEFNKRAHENLGFTREEFEKLKIPDFEVIDDAEEISKHIKKIIKEGADTFETKHRTKSGEVRDIHVSSRAISIGGRTFLHGIWRDITDLNQAKEALKESEATARALINAPTDSVFLIDTRGIILDINETAIQKSDKHADEYIGSYWYDLYSPDLAENIKEQANKVIQSGKPVRFENEVDGIWFDTVIYPITDIYGEVTRLAIIARDITERKNAEEELKKYRSQLEELVKKRTGELIMTNEKLSHEINVRTQTEKRLCEAELQYRTIANFTYDWVYWDAPDRKIIYVSPSCKRITGYTQEEFLKNPGLMRKMIISEDKKIWDQHRNEVLKEQKMCEVQFRIRRKDEEVRWIEHACRPVIDAHGSFLGIRVSNRDITERKNMEEALRESESNLKRAQEVAHMGSWHLDIERDDLYWSDGVYEIFGVPIGSPLNYEKFLEIVHPEDKDFVDAKWNEALRKAFYDKQSYDIEHRIIVDGRVKWVREKAEVEFNKKGEPIRGIGIVHDITDRKFAEENAHQLKEELMHTSRIFTVGELTATLAHELNQPLTAILSNAQAVQQIMVSRNPDMAEIREIVSDIIKEDRRASNIIHKTRVLLKRSSEFNFEQLNINQVIKEIIPLIRSDLLIKKISLQMDLEEGIPPVRGERIQLQQVILNLLANGMDAMNNVESKILTIRTEQESALTVRVSIEDSGIGVDENRINDLFEPFYTTKKDGMGMGLAISHSIIDAHGGKLQAKNNPDHGATFFFTIPMATDRSA